MLLHLILTMLATFWAWMTIRYAVEAFLPRVFELTRVVHPLIVAAFPLMWLWPDVVSALGVAGATGILIVIVERSIGGGGAPVQMSRTQRRGGLPALP